MTDEEKQKIDENFKELIKDDSGKMILLFLLASMFMSKEEKLSESKNEPYYCRRKKNEDNKLFDMNHFDEWFYLTYTPVNCGGLPVPKVISFKEHVRILKEKDNEYNQLLNQYNELVESYNRLQKAYCGATGERYIEEE